MPHAYVKASLHRPKPRNADQAGGSLFLERVTFEAGVVYAPRYHRYPPCLGAFDIIVHALANDNARLGADADRYSFIVSDFHRLLPTGLPAHFESDLPG